MAANPILSAIPGAPVVDPANCTLLGSPIGDTASITSVVYDKIHHLTIMGKRLHHLTMQDALLLLCNSFAIPKRLYIIRSSPSFLSLSLQRYDKILRSIVSDITNINLYEATWPRRITLVQWRCGRLLVCDATCPDTFAPSHLPRDTSEAGAVAALAEQSKHEKYQDLNQCHIFTPVAIKTAGPFGPETFSFLRELGCRLKQVTGELKSFSYLQQRLSVTVQRGECAAVMVSMGSTTSSFDFFK